MAVLVLIIFAVFFLPFYLKNKVYTVPEFLERRFNYSVRAYASVIAIILNVIVDISATAFKISLQKYCVQEANFACEKELLLVVEILNE